MRALAGGPLGGERRVFCSTGGGPPVIDELRRTGGGGLAFRFKEPIPTCVTGIPADSKHMISQGF